MTDEFRALLERIIAGEKGVNKADKAAGLPRGTFSRWLTMDQVPRRETLVKLATRLGQKYQFSALHILAMTGYVPKGEHPPPPPVMPGLETALRAAYRDGANPDEYRALEIHLVREVERFRERNRVDSGSPAQSKG